LTDTIPKKSTERRFEAAQLAACASATKPRHTLLRRLLPLASVLVVLGGVFLFWGLPFVQNWLSQREPLPVGGRVVLPTDAGLVLYDLATRSQTTLVSAPPGQLVTSASWSPDGSSVAYGFFHRPAGDPASASEIYLVPAAGGEARPLAQRDRPGAVLDSPVWSPDGRFVYFTYFGQISGRAVQRVERIDVAGGDRQVIVEDAYSPSISPDGQSLLFLRDDRAGTGLWLLSLSGGEPRSVLDPTRYPGLAVPRFSPDGTRFVVAIIHTSTAASKPPPLFAWLAPPTAYAHGIPWDLWTFDLQGEDVRRLTDFAIDDPSPTWSPDGRFIMYWGGGGLFLLPSEGGNARRLLDHGGYGPIDWRP
jgi:Tol biopolymer transport system component